MYVIKRDGQKQAFDLNKILQAISKSIKATDIDVEQDKLDYLTLQVVQKIDSDVIDVEQIQEIVESVLMQQLPETAKKYIRYRSMRTQQRLSREYLKRSIDGIINIEKNDVTSENANMSSHTPSGQMMNIASQASQDYAYNYLIKDNYKKLHEQGYIHIHDLDYYATKTTTCVQYDLDKIFENGFHTKNGFIREPQSIMSYATLATIVFQTNQNEQHGGQSIPAFDFYMAKGVLKSFRKNFKQVILDFALLENQEISVEQLSEKISLIETIDYNHDLFSSFSQYLKSEIQFKQIWKIAFDKTENDTKQAMESFIHNLNTMHSRGGNQVVFSSVNYGTDTSSEGRMVIESLLEMTQKGLGKNEVPIFPIQIFKVKQGVNICDDDLKLAYNNLDWNNQKFKTKNFDLFLKAVNTSATSLFPNFLFLDASFNKNELWDANDPKRYQYEVATMGCRTRVFENLHGTKSSLSRGNLSFTSINLVRLALEAKQESDNQEQIIDIFQEKIADLIEIISNQLIDRLEYQKSAKCLQFPFMARNGVWLDLDQKQPLDTVDEALNHGTLGIGFIGGHNAMTAIFNSGHGENELAYKTLLDTVQKMQKQVEKIKNETNLNFSLLATPAEGLSGRFTRLDQKQFGIIKGVTDRDYYVNSFHIDVKDNINAFNKIKLEAPFHALTLGGHITYVEVDGEAKSNVHALLKIVEAMYRLNIGYGSINHPVDQCRDCNYKGVINEHCPQCSSISIRRMRRITGYLTGDLDSWNQAKKAEEKDRRKHL